MTTESLLQPPGPTSTWDRCLRGARRALLVLPIASLGLLGCNDLTGSQQLPSGTPNPSSFSTPTGALTMRNAAIFLLEQEIPQYIVNSGLLSDELTSNLVGNLSLGQLLQKSSLPPGGSLDERVLPELSTGPGTVTDQDYGALQAARGAINQALGALVAYDSAAPPALRGELYALDGYTEILLADLFCSGVPLSTLDFQQDYTYHASSSTAQVYADAIGKLDTALALSTDSVRILNLARVLKGRALLAMDSSAAAAQAVAAVPDNFQYQLAFQASDSRSVNFLLDSAAVSDREGGNGLPYVSSNDPRTQTIGVLTPLNTGINVGQTATLRYPVRYPLTGFTPFTVADWIEARLIEAEAALRAGDPAAMIVKLNHLRETATVPGQTGNLSDTTDPGTAATRVSLLFQERAYWLFVTGHRQGDLRRLLRQYPQIYQSQAQVYPTGPYNGPGVGLYGSDVTAPIPSGEYANPLFNGCINRGA